MHHLPSRYIPCDGRLTASAYFNHAPRMGSDNRPPYYALYYIIFQSTLPAGGATFRRHKVCQVFKHFNPRSLHWERPPMTFLNMNFLLISIHAPRGGSDMKYLPDLLKVQVFQSTLPT